MKSPDQSEATPIRFPLPEQSRAIEQRRILVGDINTGLDLLLGDADKTGYSVNTAALLSFLERDRVEIPSSFLRLETATLSVLAYRKNPVPVGPYNPSLGVKDVRGGSAFSYFRGEQGEEPIVNEKIGIDKRVGKATSGDLRFVRSLIDFVSSSSLHVRETERILPSR